MSQCYLFEFVHLSRHIHSHAWTFTDGSSAKQQGFPLQFREGSLSAFQIG